MTTERDYAGMASKADTLPKGATLSGGSSKVAAMHASANAAVSELATMFAGTVDTGAPMTAEKVATTQNR